MEINFRSDIKSWLNKLERLQPIPTELNTKLSLDHPTPVKAVIFDIYGTLLISASGDIEEASLNHNNLREAMQTGGFNLSGCTPGVYSFLLEQLQLKIKQQHNELREKGHPYPDVDILRVWQEMFAEAQKKGLIKLSGNESYYDTIFVFELLSNKVYPMPGMKEILLAIREKGIPLGIVSNAQFYTPIIMNYFLTGEFLTRREIEYFNPDLSVFSFEELRAKPDTALFQKFIPILKSNYGIQAHEALFVGNDMLKDIYTAGKSGLRTALFAGDKRSLRLREADERTQNIQADFILNDLSQLLEIIA
ncbi:MAG: HAD family hydrolase [Draconibacterium sp.]